MTSSETHLEDQLKEAGNDLLNLPSSIDDLLTLLDKVENLLASVEQAPSKSMQDALLPSMKALISIELLRHSEMDVKVSVASCITEITRITAPDAPYDDDQMKEIFQLTVAAFEKLSHVSSRCYTKAVSILDTVAKVRSCLVMLDLECDALVVEMFQNFLKIIRSNHPHAVFSAMETIMTVVIDESEEISLELLSPLLASVRKEHQNVSPISWKLGEKVISNCAVKLKPYLKEAVRSMGIALDDYAQIVTSVCQSESDHLKHEHVNGSREHLADESKLGKRTVSNEPPRRDPNEPSLVTMGVASDTVCPTKVGQAVDGASKSAVSNGTPTRNDDGLKNINSSKRLQSCRFTKHSKSIGARSYAEPENLDSMKAVKSELEPDSGLKKRDHCLPDVSHPKRGRPKKKGNNVNQDADPNSLAMSKGGFLNAEVEEKALQSADVSLKKESEVTSNSDAKPQRRSRKIGMSLKTNEETTQTPGRIVSEKEATTPSGTEEKLLQPSDINVGIMNINNRLSIQTDSKKRKRKYASSEKDITEASNSKDSGELDLDERLVGRKINVWWPMDKMFYEGVVNSYDPVKKRHQVLYEDGDEETLNLKKERWELIGDDVLPGGKETDLPNPDASSDMPKKRKGKAKSESAKQEKADSSSKRSGTLVSLPKVDSTKCGGNSADDPKLDKPIIVYEPVNDPSRTVEGSKDVGHQKSSGKSSIERPKGGNGMKQTMPRTVTLPKGFL